MFIIIIDLIRFYDSILLFIRRIFSLFSQGISHGMSSRLEFVILQCISFRNRALSGYYYSDYVIIGVLRPSRFTEILFLIGLLLSIK